MAPPVSDISALVILWSKPAPMPSPRPEKPVQAQEMPPAVIVAPYLGAGRRMAAAVEVRPDGTVAVRGYTRRREGGWETPINH